MVDLPVIHLDQLFWRENWTPVGPEIFGERALEACAAPEWIIDGNNFSNMRERFARADAIVFLDYSTVLCLARVLRRILSGYGKNRPDVAEGCPERFDLPFLRYVLSFRRKFRPKIVDLLAEYPDCRIFVSRSPGETDGILTTVREEISRQAIKPATRECLSRNSSASAE
jgi:adenylate kinase family enzyme